jgi:Fe-S-cluster containining protein
MKRVLPVLPKMQCDDGCGFCCSVVPASRDEYNTIIAFAKRSGIQPIHQGARCPWYQGGKCSVYEVRPVMCHAYGHVASMTCPRGYNRNISVKIVNRALKDTKSDKNPELLHQALVDFGVAPIDVVQAELTAYFQNRPPQQEALS